MALVFRDLEPGEMWKDEETKKDKTLPEPCDYKSIIDSIFLQKPFFYTFGQQVFSKVQELNEPIAYINYAYFRCTYDDWNNGCHNKVTDVNISHLNIVTVSGDVYTLEYNIPRQDTNWQTRIYALKRGQPNHDVVCRLVKSCRLSDPINWSLVNLFMTLKNGIMEDEQYGGITTGIIEHVSKFSDL